MDLIFKVTHGVLEKVSCPTVVERSRNHVRCVFEFATDDWSGLVKTVWFEARHIMDPVPVILDENNACYIPEAVLSRHGQVKMSVSGESEAKRATTTVHKFIAHDTLYGGKGIAPPVPSVYEQILALIARKADGMSYEGNVLSLLAEGKAISSVTIVGGGSGDTTNDTTAVLGTAMLGRMILGTEG